MPVYFMTAHSYRSWSENHPRGFVQRGQGLKRPSAKLAAHRQGKARFEEARFDRGAQLMLHEVVVEIARERDVRLHAFASCPTHGHALFSFRSPACTCGALKLCRKGCPAKAYAEEVFVRMKRKMGQRIAQLHATDGRPWFSRGWDTKPVRDKKHFDYLIGEYLPAHEIEQAGICRVYR
jgi:hypothetical protein